MSILPRGLRMTDIDYILKKTLYAFYGSLCICVVRRRTILSIKCNEEMGCIYERFYEKVFERIKCMFYYQCGGSIFGSRHRKFRMYVDYVSTGGTGRNGGI